MSEKHTFAHVIAEFAADEPMGRTIIETAARIPGSHHLITTLAREEPPPGFAGLHRLGSQGAPLAKVLHRVKPDLVHLHLATYRDLRDLWELRGLRRFLGSLGSSGPHGSPRVLAPLYAWPGIPSFTGLPTPGWPVPSWFILRMLRRAGITELLTPDPLTLARLRARERPWIRTTWLPSGAPLDERRAQFTTRQPIIVCSGRANEDLGVHTLLSAFPMVREQVPDARLRLLLLPHPQLPGILRAAQATSRNVVRQATTTGIVVFPRAPEPIEVITETSPDLLPELAAAQVGTWPYLNDYGTLPPTFAVAQAGCVGLPAVGTDVACVRAALAPGVTGLLVPPDDPVALARCLTRLLVDEVLWYRYARAGPAHAATSLGWDLAAQTTERVYGSRAS